MVEMEEVGRCAKSVQVFCLLIGFAVDVDLYTRFRSDFCISSLVSLVLL